MSYSEAGLLGLMRADCPVQNRREAGQGAIDFGATK